MENFIDRVLPRVIRGHPCPLRTVSYQFKRGIDHQPNLPAILAQFPLDPKFLCPTGSQPSRSAQPKVVAAKGTDIRWTLLELRVLCPLLVGSVSGLRALTLTGSS